MSEAKYCLHCSCELNALDADPNGDMPAVCVKCRAEEAHDFDAEPNVRFARSGRRIDAWPTTKED